MSAKKRPEEGVPISDSDDDMKPGDGARDGSGHPSPRKKNRGEEQTLTVDMLKMLLAETRDAILDSNKDMVKQEISKLEAKQAKRFERV